MAPEQALARLLLEHQRPRYAVTDEVEDMGAEMPQRIAQVVEGAVARYPAQHQLAGADRRLERMAQDFPFARDVEPGVIGGRGQGDQHPQGPFDRDRRYRLRDRQVTHQRRVLADGQEFPALGIEQELPWTHVELAVLGQPQTDTQPFSFTEGGIERRPEQVFDVA
jgi:hypothetical protein